MLRYKYIILFQNISTIFLSEHNHKFIPIKNQPFIIKNLDFVQFYITLIMTIHSFTIATLLIIKSSYRLIFSTNSVVTMVYLKQIVVQ